MAEWFRIVGRKGPIFRYYEIRCDDGHWKGRIDQDLGHAGWLEASIAGLTTTRRCSDLRPTVTKDAGPQQSSLDL